MKIDREIVNLIIGNSHLSYKWVLKTKGTGGSFGAFYKIYPKPMFTTFHTYFS